MVSVTQAATPVIFIDTEMLFAETLVYQQELAERLALRDLRIIRPDAQELARTDAKQTLYRRDTDACCALRKTRPLQRALAGFDGWITGRKRYQPAPAPPSTSSKSRTAPTGSRSTRWPIGRATTSGPTWRKTACPGIRW
jgi:hypothetical protein